MTGAVIPFPLGSWPAAWTRHILRKRPLWERAAEYDGQRIPFTSPLWPEIAVLQRERLIRMAEWHDDMTVTLAFREPPPVDGWRCMHSAPRNATWIIVRNDAGEHRAHWAEDMSGEEQPAFRGWFREALHGCGFVELPGGEPTEWRPDA